MRFPLIQLKIAIQDLSGLIPMPQPGENASRLSRILQSAGVPEDEARRAAQKIGAMQAPPQWTPLQDPYELRVIAGLSATQIQRLARVATLYPAGSFNPGTATPEALATLHSGSALQGLAALRARDELHIRRDHERGRSNAGRDRPRPGRAGGNRPGRQDGPCR